MKSLKNITGLKVLPKEQQASIKAGSTDPMSLFVSWANSCQGQATLAASAAVINSGQTVDSFEANITYIIEYEAALTDCAE